MEEYKQYLNEDADEAERRAAAQVMEGLTGLRLESKVREVAAERAALRRRAFWQSIFVSVVALVLVAGAAYLFLREEKATPSVPQQQEQLSAPQANNQTSPPEKTPDKKENAPSRKYSPASVCPIRATPPRT